MSGRGMGAKGLGELWKRVVEDKVVNVSSCAVLLHSMIAAECTAVVQARQSLNTDKHAWKTRPKAAYVFSKRDVTLDVGGEKRRVSVSTLCGRPGLFKTLFSGYVDVQLDQDHSVFIDYSPTYIDHLLDWVRGEALHIEPQEKNGLL